MSHCKILQGETRIYKSWLIFLILAIRKLKATLKLISTKINCCLIFWSLNQSWVELTHVEDCFKTLNHYQTPFKSTSMVTLIIRCMRVIVQWIICWQRTSLGTSVRRCSTSSKETRASESIAKPVPTLSQIVSVFKCFCDSDQYFGLSTVIWSKGSESLNNNPRYLINSTGIVVKGPVTENDGGVFQINAMVLQTGNTYEKRITVQIYCKLVYSIFNHCYTYLNLFQPGLKSSPQQT